MDPFHHRDMVGDSRYEYSLPRLHSETSFRTSSPPTPQPSYSSPSLLRSPLSLGPIRSITPPEDTASLGGEQHAAVKKFKSPYDQVCEYVDCFKDWRSGVNTKRGSLEVYGNNLSIEMSLKEWSKLRHDLNTLEMDEKFPRYSYNSFTSTLIIQFMPTPVHESITSIFSEGFAVAKSTLPAPLRNRIVIVANQDFNGFTEQYGGSSKAPDLAVKFKSTDGKVKPKFVLEVGFSETYDSLLQNARMWLEGGDNVSVLVLVNYEETPRYRCPVRHFNVEDFERLGFPEAREVQCSDFNLDGEYGPATYKGFRWVGQISTAFMEIWRKNPTTGLATQDGDRIASIDLHSAANPPRIEFQLSDILDDIEPENERTIPFLWDDYSIQVKTAIEELALYRCREVLTECSRDRDYVPTDSSELSE